MTIIDKESCLLPDAIFDDLFGCIAVAEMQASALQLFVDIAKKDTEVTAREVLVMRKASTIITTTF